MYIFTDGFFFYFLRPMQIRHSNQCLMVGVDTVENEFLGVWSSDEKKPNRTQPPPMLRVQTALTLSRVTGFYTR